MVNVALRVRNNLINNIIDHITLDYSYMADDKFNIVFQLRSFEYLVLLKIVFCRYLLWYLKKIIMKIQ